MTCARSVKINFQGESRDVTLHVPPTLAGLQAAVSSIFSADLPPRSTEVRGAADGDLRFICKDFLGDDIVFDKDAELSLALRLSPEPLEISAARKVESKVSCLAEGYSSALLDSLYNTINTDSSTAVVPGINFIIGSKKEAESEPANLKGETISGRLVKYSGSRQPRSHTPR